MKISLIVYLLNIYVIVYVFYAYLT